MNPALSIVIPAYNEAGRLDRSLARIRDYLANGPIAAGTVEIIVVDDGSTDATADIVRRWMADMPCIRLLQNPANRGKGYSVRRGMLQKRAVP